MVQKEAARTRGSLYSASGYMSFAQRATFGRGRAGSGYALAAPRDNFGGKIFGRNFSKIGENFIFVFFIKSGCF